MNKQDGPNGIDWTTWTWNPVTGCKHGCPYCYAKRLYDRFQMSFEPAYHAERLEEIQKAAPGDKVFVCSMADLFGDWVPDEWIRAVVYQTASRADVTFQFLTKNPKRYAEFGWWPPNCWIGASATDSHEAEAAARILRDVHASVRFLSLEPLMGWQLEEYAFIEGINWAIVGPQTGPGWHQNTASVQEFEAAIACCAFWDIPVFMKRACSLAWKCTHTKFLNMGLRKEFPIPHADLALSDDAAADGSTR